MKIKEIVKLITDTKVYIEIKEKNSGASFGFYTNVYIPEQFEDKEIVSINVQYVDGKRLIVLEF